MNQAIKWVLLGILMCVNMSLKAQRWQDDLRGLFKEFNDKTTEQRYMANIAVLDAIVENNPDVWQPAYYAAWYRLAFLNRSDFKTETYSEKMLYRVSEIIDPWLIKEPNEELYILNALANYVRLIKMPQSGSAVYVDEIEKNLQMADQFYYNHPRKLLVDVIYNYHYQKIEEPLKVNRLNELISNVRVAFDKGISKSYPLMPSWGLEILDSYIPSLR